MLLTAPFFGTVQSAVSENLVGEEFVTDDLIYLFDATQMPEDDEDDVDVLTDQSGNGLHIPLRAGGFTKAKMDADGIGGAKAAYFNGSNAYQIASDIFGAINSAELFIVFKNNDVGNCIMCFANGLWIPYGDQTVYDTFGTTAYDTIYTVAPGYFSTARMYNSSVGIEDLGGGFSESNKKVYVDTVEVYSQPAGIGFGTGIIVGSHDGGDGVLVGWLGAIGIYSVRKTDAERAQNNAAAKSKFALSY